MNKKIVLLALFSSAIAIINNYNYSVHAQQTSSNIPATSIYKHSNNIDKKRFQEIMQFAIDGNLTAKNIGEIMQTVAEQFLGAQYKAGILDSFKQETLVTSLTQFDCVLFVETVLALARGIAIEDYSYNDFSDRILQQRYRDGNMSDYCTRLHYFSEWIDNNQKRGIVSNITSALGGIALSKHLNFMSNHRQSYWQIASNETTYQCIVNMENNIANLNLSYIPKQQIKQIYPQLQPGDIIAVTTNIEGLDFTHTGLFYRSADGNIGLIHASPVGRVVIASDLSQYINQVKNTIGIVVARPNNLSKY